MIANARWRVLPGIIGLVCAFGLLVPGCGSTQIMASDRNATIFVNGAQVGKGQAKISRRGGPAAVEIRAETPDGRTTRTVIKREFSPLLSFIIFWGWAYPDEVNLELPAAPELHGWDSDRDPWSNAPAGWQAASDDSSDRPSSPPAWNSPENTQSSPRKDQKPSRAPERPRAPDPDDKPAKPADSGSAWDRPPSSR